MPKSLQIGSEAEISRLILDELTYIHGAPALLAGRLAIWDGSRWAFLEPRTIQDSLFALDGAEYPGGRGSRRTLRIGRRLLDDIGKLVLRTVDRPSFLDHPQPGIPFANAFIHVHEGRIAVSTPRREHGNSFSLDLDWDRHLPEAPPEGSLLNRYLAGVFHSDPEALQKSDLLSEIAGSALAGLATLIPAPKAVILLGERAANGKSQFLRLLEGLVPAEARANLSPESHDNQRHLALLDGMRLNLADEIGGLQHASERFKAAVTGDAVLACRLYQDGFTFRPRAQHVFASNALPAFRNGADAGLLRRLMILQFDRQIPAEARIPDIGKRIVEDELHLLVGWAMAGAVRLSRAKRFTEPASSLTALKALSFQSNPVEAWLETGNVDVTGRVQDRLATRKAYHLFLDWARQEGLKESSLPTQTGFSQAVQRFAFNHISLVRNNQGNVLTGLRPKGGAACR